MCESVSCESPPHVRGCALSFPGNGRENCHGLRNFVEEDISGLLVAWGNGNPAALERLVVALYPELRRIARRHLARRPGEVSLESAAVANEAFLKLSRARGIPC